jgi:hypothetical protein
VIKNLDNEEAKARYRAKENTTTMGCNARKTNNKQGRVTGTVSGLRDEMPGVVIPVKEKKTFIVNFQTGSGAHSASFSVGTGFPSRC